MSSIQNLPPKILYIDTREPAQFGLKIAELCPIQIEFKQLETGDYICEDVAIERKTVDDFCMSIIGIEQEKNGRLFTQSERLTKEFPHRYIFVTGNYKDRKVNVHTHALLGALASVAKHGVTVVFGLTDEDDFVYLLLKTFEKHGELQMFKNRPKSKPKTKIETPDKSPPEEPFVGVIE